MSGHHPTSDLFKLIALLAFTAPDYRESGLVLYPLADARDALTEGQLMS